MNGVRREDANGSAAPVGRKRGRGATEPSSTDTTMIPPAKAAKSDNEWDEDLHRQFVSAVFEVGLRNASPAVILENMFSKSKHFKTEN